MIQPPIPNLLRGLIFVGLGLVYLLAVYLKYQSGVTFGVVLIAVGVYFLVRHYLRQKKDADNSAT